MSSLPGAPPADTSTSLAPDGPTDLREGYAEVGDVKLHYVEAGDGPLIVLLHGFPEFWYGWRLQIAPLAAAGFRVVAASCICTGRLRRSAPPTGTRRRAWRTARRAFGP